MTALDVGDSPAGGRARTALWSSARLLRAVGVCVLGGMVAGALVGGAGSRLAMRVSGAMTGGSRALVTENGNILGRFTVEGTFFLVLFATVGVGVIGGVTYAAARSWLAPAVRRRGLLFGALLLVAYGMVTLEAGNVDFTRFGNPTVNVVLFASLYLLYGIVVVAVADRLERIVPAVPPAGRLGLRGTLAVLPAIGAGLLGVGLLVVLTRATLSGPFGGDPADQAFAVGVAVFVAVVWLAAVGSRISERWPSTRRWAAAIVLMPVAIGGVITIREIADILTS